MNKVRITINEFSVDFELIINFLVKALFILFVYFSMFSRKLGFLGLSGGMVAAMFSFLIFSLSVFYILFIKENYKISQLACYIIIVLTLLSITPIVSSFYYNIQPGLIIRFIIEVCVVIFIFIGIYNFVRLKVISPRFFIYSLAILGLIASLVTLRELIGANLIRRVVNISGVNYVGTSFAMSAVAWIMVIYIDLNDRFKKTNFLKTKIFCFVIVIIAMLLTGTRSATIAFLLGLFVLQYVGIRSKVFNRYLILFGIGVGIAVTIIALNIDLSRLWDRYSLEQITNMAGIRFQIYAESVTDMTLSELILGRPDLYIFSSDLTGDRYINTHNLFLSLIRYHGFLILFSYLILLIIVFWNYLNLNRLRTNNPLFRGVESSTLVFFCMALTYTMFSGGRPTRAFSLFITLGYLAGYFELLKNIRSYDDYKKLIF